MDGFRRMENGPRCRMVSLGLMRGNGNRCELRRMIWRIAWRHLPYGFSRDGVGMLDYRRYTLPGK